MEEQRTLLGLQAHHSAIDRLNHRRGSLPEDVRLAELTKALATVDQLAAERDGSLATVRREQTRLEDKVDMVSRKAHSEEQRAVSGKVTSPKELTAIQEEVAALKRRQGVLEDDLLERMEQRETLEAEQAELASQRERIAADQAEVTKVRDLPGRGSRPGGLGPGSPGPRKARRSSSAAASATPTRSTRPNTAATCCFGPAPGWMRPSGAWWTAPAPG
jgi:hypothetical protein